MTNFNKKYIIAISLLSGTIRAEFSEPPRPLSYRESLVRSRCNWHNEEEWGNKKPNKKLQESIKTVKDRLGMSDYCIEPIRMPFTSPKKSILRKIAEFPSYLCEITTSIIPSFNRKIGNEKTAFVIPSIFRRKSHSHLHVNEKECELMPQEQVKAIIGKNLIHIKDNHARKQFILEWMRNIGIAGTTFIINKSDHKVLSALTFTPLNLAFCHLYNRYNYHIEKSADIKSARELKCAQSLVDLYSKKDNDINDYESRFLLRRILHTFCNFPRISELFRSTPSPRARKEYLEPIASQQAAEQAQA